MTQLTTSTTLVLNREASVGNNEEQPASLGSLPGDVITVILNMIRNIPDYINFSSISSKFRNITNNENEVIKKQSILKSAANALAIETKQYFDENQVGVKRVVEYFYNAFKTKMKNNNIGYNHKNLIYYTQKAYKVLIKHMIPIPEETKKPESFNLFSFFSPLLGSKQNSKSISNIENEIKDEYNKLELNSLISFLSSEPLERITPERHETFINDLGKQLNMPIDTIRNLVNLAIYGEHWKELNKRRHDGLGTINKIGNSIKENLELEKKELEADLEKLKEKKDEIMTKIAEINTNLEPSAISAAAEKEWKKLKEFY